MKLHPHHHTGAADPVAKGRGWYEILVFAALAALVFALLHLASHGKVASRTTVIDLAPAALPGYAALSLARVLLSSALSVALALGLGYWTTHDPVAERYVLPILDHARRNLPVVGLLPLLALGLMTLFGGRVGIEIAAVLALVLSQMWPIAKGFRSALKEVPPQLREMADAFHFGTGRRFRKVELPYGTAGLVWNAMLGMARAWFVLIVAETLVQGTHDLRLPGLGSYLDAAVRQDRPDAVVWALATMTGIVVGMYLLVWHPLLVWAQKFRLDEEGAPELEPSRVLAWLRRFRMRHVWKRVRKGIRKRVLSHLPGRKSLTAARWSLPWKGRLSVVVLVVAAGPLAYGAFRLGGLLLDVSPRHWVELLLAGGLSLGRVLLTLLLATLWALPVGLAIGLSPRLTRWAGPAVLVAASFPATLLFAPAAAVFDRAGISLDWGCVVLMLLACQWYILFNVMAGAEAIPADLREAVRCFRLSRWRLFWTFQVPAVFPSLVLGWESAAGLAWSTSLVAEALTHDGELWPVHGLGHELRRATQQGEFAVVAAALLVLGVILELFSRFVWGRLSAVARQRYAFGR